jgi:Protein of unknown function (DUF2975)
MATKSLPKTKTEQILTVMPILAWVAFIGFMIEAGAILLSYVVSSVINPDAATNLYRGLNLFNLRQFSFWHYTLVVSFLVALSLMKSWASFLVIGALSKFNLKNPFTMEVAMRLERISMITFGTWVVTMLYNAHLGWLLKKTGELHGTWLSGEFIFMIGIVFILSQVFKRGVEIQSENELTV